MAEYDEQESMIGKAPAEPKRTDDELLQLIRERAVICADAWQDNHDRAEESVDFAEGLNHWPAELKGPRDSMGQPCLVLNDMPIFIDRICGEQLQNRQSINVSPGDSFGAEYEFTGAGKKKRSAATVREGMIRQIEYKSNAQAHYDRAHQHAVDGGIGWLRVYTRYASGTSFDQELVIGSVRNRWSVMLDTDCDEPDMSDARYGFVHSSMLKQVFEDEYPKAMIGDLGNLPERQRTFWGKEARITVSEYMTREPHERVLVLLSNGQTGYEDDLKGHLKGDLLVGADGKPVPGQDQLPVRVVRRRPVQDWCVYWRKCTAWSVLEGPIKLPFKTVPLIPVFGRQRDLRDGRQLLSSAIHHAMDTKRMEEYWMSAATGRVALSPLAPYVGDAQAFEGYERFWERANRDPMAYLPFNSMNGQIPPPQRTEPATMPIAELQLTAQMHDRTKAAIGIYDASLGAQSNETSGRAINARDRQSSTSSYVFGDNLTKAIRRVGLLLNEALPVIYDTERQVALRNVDGTTEWQAINTSAPGPDGKPVVENSLSAGEFDVVVTTGPSYVTQRQEAAETQTAIMQAAPDMIPIMADTVAENMDWPGAEKLAMRIRRQMPPQLLTKAEQEEVAEYYGDPEPQPGPDGQPMPQPDPAQAMQAKVLEAQTMAALKKSDAEMATAEASMAQADADKAKAAADLMEAQMRMQALQMGGLAPQLPTVGQKPNGQEMPNG